jgi:hypothetical protein
MMVDTRLSIVKPVSAECPLNLAPDFNTRSLSALFCFTVSPFGFQQEWLADVPCESNRYINVPLLHTYTSMCTLPGSLGIRGWTSAACDPER